MGYFIKRKLLGGSLLVLVVSALVIINPIYAELSNENYLETRIDDYISTSIKNLNIPAATVAISKGDSIIYHSSFGEDIKDNSRFFIGSISKTFTGLAIAQLVEDDLIDLDKPVSYYIEEFSVSDEIKVKHLLHHVSGMVETEYNSFGALDPNATFLDLIHDMSGMSLSYPPGETFAYFNPNYSLLGLVIERVTGLSYEEYMQNHIFDQLGLNNSSLEDDIEIEGHLSFFGFPVRRAETFNRYDLPGGFISASSYDLLLFLDAIRKRDPSTGLSEQGFDRFLSVYPEEGFYSMGLMHYPLGNTTAIHHGGSLPGFLANAIILPEEDISIAILLNKNHLLFATLFQPSFSEGIINILTNSPPPTLFKFYWLYRALFILMIIVIILNLKNFLQMICSDRFISKNQRFKSIVVNLFIILVIITLVPLIGSNVFPQRGFDLNLVFLLMPDFTVFLFVGLLSHVIKVLTHVYFIASNRIKKINY